MSLDRAQRTLVPELMDTESVSFEDFRECLRDLSTANVLSLGYRPTLAFLESLRTSGRLPEGRPLRILDVGSGYGDTLRHVARWAEAHGVPVTLIGVDLNPWSARAAAEATPRTMRIEWVTANVFDYAEHAEPADVILSALFTHHLTDAEVVEFVRWMEKKASLAWFVNDLHRAHVAHRFFRSISTAMRWHRFVRHDGPVSIARAFRRHEWRSLLIRAGIPRGATQLSWFFPYRLCVARVRPNAS